MLVSDERSNRTGGASETARRLFVVGDGAALSDDFEDEFGAFFCDGVAGDGDSGEAWDFDGGGGDGALCFHEGEAFADGVFGEVGEFAQEVEDGARAFDVEGVEEEDFQGCEAWEVGEGEEGFFEVVVGHGDLRLTIYDLGVSAPCGAVVMGGGGRVGRGRWV